MNEDFKYERRRFMGTAAMTIAAAQLGMFSSAAESKEESTTSKFSGKYEHRLTTVTCPCQTSQFDASSGAVIRGAAKRPVRSRSVQTEGDDLLIES